MVVVIIVILIACANLNHLSKKEKQVENHALQTKNANLNYAKTTSASHNLLFLTKEIALLTKNVEIASTAIKAVTHASPSHPTMVHLIPIWMGVMKNGVQIKMMNPI